MRKHHTKEKGDFGVVAVVFDLKKSGITSCLPMSEHLPFDLIAVSADGQLSRVSVKFRCLTARSQSIDFGLRSCWADRKGTHVIKHAKTEYDCLAIYCPDVNKCFYIRVEEIKGHGIWFKPNDKIEYLNPKRIFAPVAQIDSARIS